MLTPILLLCALVAGEESSPDLSWGKGCPTTCTCHVGHLRDLPIKQWLEREEVQEQKPPTSVTNEAFYEDDGNRTESALHSERGILLKIAVCIFQTSSDPQKVLNKLPNDIQALTLLQSRGSEDITLEADHMKKFQHLVYFHIQGYSPDTQKDGSGDHMTDHNFMLSNDVMKPLISLQYLSLQHVKLLGSSLKSNEIDHEGHSSPQLDPHQNEISLNLQPDIADRMRKHFKTPLSNLVVLKSTSTEQELMPYQIYKEQQERARLSIFARLSNLVLLRVIDCGLHEVYWEMFEGLGKLEHLSLEKNQLLFLPEFAFYGAPSLKTLSLAHNRLLNIHSTGLAGLLELQKLDLSYNNFSHLSEFSLPPFPKLKEAYFWHNPIEAVFGSTFEIMNATRVLYLGSNNSSLTLHPKSFQGLHQLQKLVLYNVGIEVLEKEILSGMPQLRYLKLSGTIVTISFDAFLDSPLLETLELQHCNIKSVSMDSFYGLYRLTILDLSNNLLEALPPGLFDQQSSLRELYLQNNSLSELPDGFFTSVSAKMIRLEGNLWHCSCNMKGWLPSATNRVKEVKSERRICENDKGIGCPVTVQGVLYVYDKKVAPRCVTPSEFNGWSIYYVLRKELRCSKPEVRKFNRQAHLRRKYKEYEKSITQNKKQVISNAQISETNFTFLENTNMMNSFINLENNTLLNKPPQQPSQAVQQSHKTEILKSNHSTLTTSPNTPEIYNEPNKSNTQSIKNTVGETIENLVPLIPPVPKQTSSQHFKSRIQPKEDILSNDKAAHIEKKVVKKPVEQSNLLKIQLHEETQNARFLKKLRKTELQRKHQEKLKNQA
ncbi:Toll-like receptor 6 [Gryllus bimaculatus]|nr:Toll-like receptor 6 [Gryllus bimaculatus]